MTRFETIGRIVDCLHRLSDDSLATLLSALSDGISDKTLNAITYGRDDTEHLQSSPINAKDLDQAVKELEGLQLLEPRHVA